MAHVVIMPRQGNTVESCIIVGWNKKEGDLVKADTPLCDVETDKATFEVVAGTEGTLLKILHEAGMMYRYCSPLRLSVGLAKTGRPPLFRPATAL